MSAQSQSPSSGQAQSRPPLFGGQPPPHLSRQPPGNQPMQVSPGAGASPGGDHNQFFPPQQQQQVPSGPPPSGAAPPRPPFFPTHPPPSGLPPQSGLPPPASLAGVPPPVGGAGRMSPAAGGESPQANAAPSPSTDRAPPSANGSGGHPSQNGCTPGAAPPQMFPGGVPPRLPPPSASGPPPGQHPIPHPQSPGDMTRPPPPGFGGVVRPPGVPGQLSRPPGMGDSEMNRPPGPPSIQGGMSRPPGPSNVQNMPGPPTRPPSGPLNIQNRPPGPGLSPNLQPPGLSNSGPPNIQNRPPGPGLLPNLQPPGLSNSGPPNIQNRPPGPGPPPNLQPPGLSNSGPPNIQNRPPGPGPPPNLQPPGLSNSGPPNIQNRPPGPGPPPNLQPPGLSNSGPPNIQNRPPGPGPPPNLQPPGLSNTGPPNIQNRPPGPSNSGTSSIQSRPPGPSSTQPSDAQNRPPGPSNSGPVPPNVQSRPAGPQGVGHPPGTPSDRPPGQVPQQLDDTAGRPPGPSADMNRPPGQPPQSDPTTPGEMPGPRFRPPSSGPPLLSGPPRGGGFPQGNMQGPRPLMNPPFPFPQQGPPPVGDFPPTEVWFEHATPEGKLYYSNAQTRKTVWDRPQNARIIPPPPFRIPPAVQAGSPDPSSPFPSFPPGFPPPALPGNPQLVPTRVWSDHATPDGRMYYYNKVTKQSVWEMPKDFELVMPLPLSFSAPPTTPVGNNEKSKSGPDGSSGGKDASEGGKEESEMMELDEGNPPEGPERQSESKTTPSGPSPAPSFAQPPLLGTAPNFPPPGMPLLPPGLNPMIGTPIESSPTPLMQLTSEPAKPESGGPRPVASVPIPATPWSVVWTSDERQFFFNATKNISVWSTPGDLVGSESLQEILDNPPSGVGGKKRRSVSEGPATKRLRLSDSDNSDEEEEVVVAEGVPVISVPGDAKPLMGGPEAELKAAQLRASKPLEERQKEFKAMLLERGVSAFSTWEKELPKFVFDPRYMLLTVKERKSCFQAFIRSRTEEERREKKNKLKAVREQFRSLLETAKLNPKSSFSEFASKYSKDERFKAVEKMREREQMFSEFLGELKKVGGKQQQQKDPSKTKVEKVKQEFMDMLGESQPGITEESQWKKVKGSFDQDPRYKAVESSSKREEFFLEFQNSLTSKAEAPEADAEQTRQERIQASLKEREREVQMSRSAQEKEWGRERDQLRKNEAQQQYKALLVDHVRGPQVQWHEAKRSMKRDQRWELTKLLEHEEREQLFQDHVLELANKKRMHFRKLLEETPQITLDMPWRRARKLIKEDMRYKSFTDSDYKREVEYDKYQRDKLNIAKNEFRTLLRETKAITYKSNELVKESGRHYKDIIDVLKNDRRFLVLDCVSGERENILYQYLEEMQHKGPPPPPTATLPGERLKRPPP